jgi:hypothetical protein
LCNPKYSNQYTFNKGAWGGVVVKALRVGGSRDRSPVSGDFLRGIRQFHASWVRLSL